MSPARVPIVSPANGVKPIDVSTDLPPSTAVTEPPLPMWAVIIFVSSIGLPSNSAARSET